MAKNFSLPSDIAESTDISPSAKMVLGALLATAEYGKPEFLSLGEIGSKVGVNVPNVQMALSELGRNEFLSLVTADGVVIHLSEATSVKVHFDLRLEPRKGIEKTGQTTMDLSVEDGGVTDDPMSAVIDGHTFKAEITPDSEDASGYAVFLNIWRLDDDGAKVEHVVMGVQYENEQDAMDFWNEYKLGTPLGILEWLVTLPDMDTAMIGGPFVTLTLATFEAAVKAEYEDRVGKSELGWFSEVDDAQFVTGGRTYYHDDNDADAHSWPGLTVEDVPLSVEVEWVATPSMAECDGDGDEEAITVAEVIDAVTPRKRGKKEPKPKEL